MVEEFLEPTRFADASDLEVPEALTGPHLPSMRVPVRDGLRIRLASAYDQVSTSIAWCKDLVYEGPSLWAWRLEAGCSGVFWL